MEGFERYNIIMNETCIYNEETNEMTLIIQCYRGPLNNSFHMKIDDKLYYPLTIGKYGTECKAIFKGTLEKFKDKEVTICQDDYESKKMVMKFPFESIKTKFHPDSIIISTMCKDEDNRLEEWFNYCIKIGFDFIVIFNNTSTRTDKIKELDSKYSNLFIVDFPYKAKCGHWNNIQRASLTIGISALKYYCKWIALIDCDEFIYIPSRNDNNLRLFLHDKDSHIGMSSKLLTNKNTTDIINNNVTQICKYIAHERHYDKHIHRTSGLGDIINSVHKGGKIQPQNVITYYHIWVNNRYKYSENMVETNDLINFEF